MNFHGRATVLKGIVKLEFEQDEWIDDEKLASNSSPTRPISELRSGVDFLEGHHIVIGELNCRESR